MQLTFLSEEPHANHSQSPDSDKDWLTRVATWRSSILELLKDISPIGLFGKTSPVSCHQTEDGILVPSSGRWANSAMGGPTECWTLSSAEHTDLNGQCPNVGGVFSLSHILETGDVPLRFYLSKKACQGILRRAEKRGKDLPVMLHQALLAVAVASHGPEKPEVKTL